MKINELFSESNSGRGKYAGAGGTFARQRVDPELLNMVAQKSLYDKEVAAAKAAAPKPASPARRHEDSNNIKIYTLTIPIKEIEHWRKTRDEDWAINTAKQKHWKIGKLPEEVRQQIYDNPEWQKAVIDMWKLGEYFLALEERPQKPIDPVWWKWQKRKNEPLTDTPPEWWDAGWERFARRDAKIKMSGKPSYLGTSRSKAAGINDPDLDPREVEDTIFRIAKDTAEKNGYDLTGRRLPPRNW